MTRLFYDLRVRAILYQVLAVAGVVAAGWYLASNVSQKLAEQNIVTGFALSRPRGRLRHQPEFHRLQADRQLLPARC